MQAYLNLSTRAKLFWAFAVKMLLFALAIGFAYQAMQTMRDSQRTLLEVRMANVSDLKDMRVDRIAIRALVSQMLAGSPGTSFEAQREQIKLRSRRIQATLAKVTGRQGSSLEDKRAQLLEMETAQTAGIELLETQILPMVQRGQASEASALFYGPQLARDRKLAEITDALVEHAERTAAESVAESEREAANAMKWLLGLAALAVLSAIVLTTYIARILADPLQRLAAATQRLLAEGNLAVDIENLDRQDEVGMLGRAFREMADRLRSMMRELGDGVSVLASSASEITAATGQVAAGSAQTASAVAQTSVTAEEVKQTAKLAADKASQVQDAAQRTVEQSQTGLQAMNESIAAMRQIREQTDSVARSILRLADQGVAIGDIIATVNDLADQSNLLSVNAAIEAARAGEEGAGFRVVAQEIRSLAEQSKQATVQVKALLGEIQKATSSAVMTTEEANKAVRAGTELAEATARSIQNMATSINESAQAAAQIAASAQQQAVGMDQVAYAMQNINQASAQNVAASRQTEAAAQGLQDLGLRMKSLVDGFRK